MLALQLVRWALRLPRKTKTIQRGSRRAKYFFSQAISRCVFGSMLAKAGDSRAKRRHTSSGCRYLALPSVLLAALMALPHPLSRLPTFGLCCAGTPLKPRWRRPVLSIEPKISLENSSRVVNREEASAKLLTLAHNVRQPILLQVSVQNRLLV